MAIRTDRDLIPRCPLDRLPERVLLLDGLDNGGQAMREIPSS
jgi:hypothetical protein